MAKGKKKTDDPDWKDPDIRDDSESSGLRTDFPLAEKDEFSESAIRNKKAHERVKKTKTDFDDNPLSE